MFEEFPLPERAISKSPAYALSSSWWEKIFSYPVSLAKQVRMAGFAGRASTLNPGVLEQVRRHQFHSGNHLPYAMHWRHYRHSRMSRLVVDHSIPLKVKCEPLNDRDFFGVKQRRDSRYFRADSWKFNRDESIGIAEVGFQIVWALNRLSGVPMSIKLVAVWWVAILPTSFGITSVLKSDGGFLKSLIFQ